MDWIRYDFAIIFTYVPANPCNSYDAQILVKS